MKIMTAVSLLEIPKWNEEIVQVSNSKPELVDYFTVSHDDKFSKDINLLKYFDTEVKLNVHSLKLKFDNDLSKDIPVKDEMSLPFKQWIDCSNKYFEDVEIVTFPSVLSKIMNTPFEVNGDKRKWKLNATFESNRIFLFPINTKVAAYTCRYSGYGITRPCNNSYNHSACDAYRVTNTPRHYELLKRYMFVKKPEKLHRKIISKWETLFYEVYKLNVGDNKLLYLSETPGVSSEQKLNSVEELKTAEHIYCDVSELGDFTQEIVNYNPVWWSRAQLINAKQCFIGIYNDRKDYIQEILNFKMDKFNDQMKYENLWSSTAAWHILDDVLSFIKNEVYKISARDSFRWEIRSFENDRPFITMIPYY